MENDIWQKIKDAVKKIAPALGNAVLPGVGGVAGTLLAEALGVDNEPDKIDAALQNATPEQIAKIQEIAAKHSERLLEIGVEQDKAFLQDVQSARQRQTEHEKITGKADKNLYVLAWVNVVGFFAICILLIFKVVPDSQSNVVYLLIGGLIAGYSTVNGYFFGSSKGSSDKTALLAAGKGQGK